MTKIGDTIMAALDLLDRQGWCRSYLVNDRGQHCAVGAVNRVLFNKESYWEDARLTPVLQALAAHVPANFQGADDYLSFPWVTCARYNNSRKSYDEIREWFQKAALDEGVTL